MVYHEAKSFIGICYTVIAELPEYLLMVYHEAKSFIGICYSHSRTTLMLTDGLP